MSGGKGFEEDLFLKRKKKKKKKKKEKRRKEKKGKEKKTFTDGSYSTRRLSPALGSEKTRNTDSCATWKIQAWPGKEAEESRKNFLMLFWTK